MELYSLNRDSLRRPRCSAVKKEWFDPPPSPLQRKQGRPEILLTGPYLFPSFAGWQLRGSVFFGGGMDRLSELQRRLPRDIFEYHIKILGIGKPDQPRNGLHRLLGLPQQFLRILSRKIRPRYALLIPSESAIRVGERSESAYDCSIWRTT